ncbi:hypothetical protein BD769DRAFT_1393382 [Suillus cothurnatus]|nr:hypothetical protein BD769DRAFT_1393382 [Suillus cothurnatus]
MQMTNREAGYPQPFKIRCVARIARRPRGLCTPMGHDVNGHGKAEPEIVGVRYRWPFINFAWAVSAPDRLHCEVHDDAYLVFLKEFQVTSRQNILGGCGLISLAQGHDLAALPDKLNLGKVMLATVPPVKGVKDG